MSRGGCPGSDLAILPVPGDNSRCSELADSKTVQIGDPIHIIGFPGVVLSHELLNQSASMEATVTNGAVSGFKQDKSEQRRHPDGRVRGVGQLRRTGGGRAGLRSWGC